MGCPSSTGACTIAPNGACIVPKTEDPFIIPLRNVRVSSLNSTFQVSWDSTPGDTDDVNIVYRILGEDFYPREVRQRSLGGFTSAGSWPAGTAIYLVVRPENYTGYGEWVGKFITIGNTFPESIPSLDFTDAENSQYIGAL